MVQTRSRFPQAGTSGNPAGESRPESTSGSPSYSGVGNISQMLTQSQAVVSRARSRQASRNTENTQKSQTPPAADASQVASALKPATTKAGKPRVRMKWDQDTNIFIMRTYYHITKLETDLTQYRQLLYQHFMEKYPNANVSEQRVSDQMRAIIRNKMVPDNTLKQLREEVQSDLQVSHNTYTGNSVSERVIQQSELSQTFTTQNNHISIDQSTQNTNTHSINLLAQDIYNPLTQNRFHRNSRSQINSDPLLLQTLKEKLETNFIKYNGTDPTSRPILPKLQPSRELTKLIALFNQEIIPSKLPTLETIEDTHTIIYCIAFTIIDHLNVKINNDRDQNNRNTPKRKPAWQLRLETDIGNLRKDIARLTQYKSGNRSNNLMQKIKDILQKYKKHSTYDDPNKRIDEYLDTSKQRLAIKSHRLKRYTKAQKRKLNNTLFKKNEKLFYRQLKNSTKIERPPSTRSLEEFWGNIWSSTEEHNKNAEWISNEVDRAKTIEEMPFTDVEEEELSETINRTHNWKAASIDGIHNFWFKKLYKLHAVLAKQISEILSGNYALPEFLTRGITFMLPKSEKTEDPSQYRPITCLPTLYKIITSCITHRITKHIDNNNILSEEQKGCRKFHRGCKEQLIIDSTILKYVQNSRKDLFISYIDYKKAFDSVPHSWLLKILDIYKIHPNIVTFLKNAMKSWRTTLKLNAEANNVITDEIHIKRGIYQGDSLSPLWFCLALNPLSNELNQTKLGFDIRVNRRTEYQLSHLLYMDDLKLYAKTNKNMIQLLDKTTMFSRDIKMDLGLDKCKKLNIVKGKIVQGNYSIGEQECIQAMKLGELYKYLGYNQARLLEHKSIKEKLRTEYLQRLYSLCNKQLSSRNLFKAINTYAIPVLTYSFGVIKWTSTEILHLETKTRTILTQYRYHHPKSAVERVTLPRIEGGRGLIDISQLHRGQIENLKIFFKQNKSSSSLHKIISSLDRQFTPLNLHVNLENSETFDKSKNNDRKHKRWREKELHGRHPHDLDQAHIDGEASNRWLETGELFPESEGFMLAIQDQVISTKNYRKYILKDTSLQNDLCRKCNNKPETIQHITGACTILTQNDYTHRHNQLANIIHQKLVQKYNLANDRHTPYYSYIPQNVLENSNYKLYYDRTILTDNTIYNNRPDITFVDKQTKHAYIIDIAVPNTNNIQSTIVEKVRKYTELQDQIKRVWRMDQVTIVPIVVSTTGVIPKQLLNGLNALNLPKYTYITLQKAAILNTCRIVRKFLQLESDTT